MCESVRVRLFPPPSLAMELVQQPNNVDVFWDEVLEKRDTINKLAGMNETIDNSNYYDKIEKPTCP